jgi:7-cyano-7-deazaguanine synthase
MDKSVVIYSGGMDSFTLLHHVIDEHDGDTSKVAALSFHYGQRHKKELDYAAREAQRLGVAHQIVDVGTLLPLLGGSALTSDVAVPEGHYAAENMKLTVVPNRNMIMLAIATGYAVSIDGNAVYFGAHAGDHDIYPDCRREFVKAMNAVTEIANYRPTYVRAPFQQLTKLTILQRGAELGLTAADYARSWTCYNGREKACGRCGSCVERLEAFRDIGWIDPLEYEDADFARAVLTAAR